jgi:hypothetical protein
LWMASKIEGQFTKRQARKAQRRPSGATLKSPRPDHASNEAQ